MQESGTVLITDIDNTLYDFVNFYAPAFRGMLHTISKTLKINEDQLLVDFKRIFQASGTLDYQYLIRQLECVADMSSDELVRIERFGRIGFDRAKRNRLVPYQGILESFAELQAGGVMIVGVTNAPYYSAIRRMQDIHVLPLIYGLVAWEGRTPDNDEEAKIRYQKVQNFARKRFSIFSTYDVSLSKPNPYGFEFVRDHLRDKNTKIFSLGDSISKDLLPAKSIDATTIWARYGTKVDPKNLKTILEITPWSHAEIDVHSNGNNYRPDHSIDDPLELLSIIPHTKQLEFF